MFLEVLKTKALLTAALAPDRASAVAKAYLELAIPTDQDEVKLEELRKEALMKEVADMKPVPLSQIRVGGIGGRTQGSLIRKE
jgi:hypothetical protein